MTLGDLIKDCEFLTGMGTGSISGNTALRLQFVELLDRAQERVASLIFQHQGYWDWGDAREGDPQPYVQNFDYNTSAYSLPSNMIRIIKAQVKDQTGRLYNLLPIDEGQSDEALSSVFAAPGRPAYYRESGNVLRLYPAPALGFVTQEGGLQIEYQKGPLLFEFASDSGVVPGFPSIYHRLLSLMASEDYASVKGLQVLPYIEKQRGEMMLSLGWGISNRNGDRRSRLVSRVTRTSYE